MITVQHTHSLPGLLFSFYPWAYLESGKFALYGVVGTVNMYAGLLLNNTWINCWPVAGHSIFAYVCAARCIFYVAWSPTASV
jgi:hypothetical protein